MSIFWQAVGFNTVIINGDGDANGYTVWGALVGVPLPTR